MIMKYRNHSLAVVLITAFFSLLLVPAMHAGMGETAGPLDYGEIERGASKTLSFGVINTDPTPMPVVAEPAGEFEGIATIEPKRTIIPTGETVQIKVTIHMPKDAEPGKNYKGDIVVKSDYSASGVPGVGAAILLAVRKEGSAKAASGEKPAEFPFPLLIVIIIIAIVAVLILRSGAFKKKVSE